MAIVSSGRADEPGEVARRRSVGSSQSETQSPVPACQSRVALSSASTVACGGSPYVALSR